MNTTGYLNNSPHRFNNKNVIPSNLITMNNVDIPLLLRPNRGKAVVAMPNSGQYTFPKADFVTEYPLAKYQPGGFSNDCPPGYSWSVADQQCLPETQTQASNFSGLSNNFITGAINPTGQRVGGTGAIDTNFIDDGNKFINENQNMNLKRIFGTPNIKNIIGTNLLAFGLSTFANSAEQGRQKAYMMNQINNSNFNGTYSNAQNDYGVDPYQQTGQFRRFFQKGGTKEPIYTNNLNDPRLRAYNDSLNLYKAYQMQDKLMGAGKGKAGPFNKNYSWTTKELKDRRIPKKIPGLDEPVSADFLNEKDQFSEGINNLWARKEDKQLLDYYKKLGFTSNQIMYHSSPDIASDKIRPIGNYFDGTAQSPIYKKPVQPIVYQKQSLNPTNVVNPVASNGNKLVMDLNPIAPKLPTVNKINSDIQVQQQQLLNQNFNLPQGNPFVRPTYNQQKTNYSFTYPDFKGDRSQQSIYFKSKQELEDFVKDNVKGASFQGTNDNYTATGYLKQYQKGGFNIFNFLYDDQDNVEDTVLKQNKKETKRITEEDVLNEDEEALKAIGLTDMDIVNMESTKSLNQDNYSYLPDSSETADYTFMYLKHQQGQAGINAIKKAADQGLDAVPRNWNKENIQANMKNNIGKDFKGKLTPANFLNYWNNKVNNNLKIAANKETPYDSLFLKVGEEEGIDPLFLKAVANIESGLNHKNNTKSKYKGLLALNSQTFKGNIFDPYQNLKAGAKNLKQYQEGGEYVVDFETMKELQAKGIKFKIIE